MDGEDGDRNAFFADQSPSNAGIYPGILHYIKPDPRF